jgi:hypothetical protein
LPSGRRPGKYVNRLAGHVKSKGTICQDIVRIGFTVWQDQVRMIILSVRAGLQNKRSQVMGHEELDEKQTSPAE